MPQAYSMSILFMSGGGAADKTGNDITSSEFVSDVAATGPHLLW